MYRCVYNVILDGFLSSGEDEFMPYGQEKKSSPVGQEGGSK